MNSVVQDFRKHVIDLEAHLKTLPQLDIPVTHWVCRGLYARQILIPKGTILTGKIHRYEHLNVIAQGDITVVTDDGVKRIIAPFTLISKAGTKRAGYAHEDTVWITIHATEETDVDKIEQELIEEEACPLLPQQ